MLRESVQSIGESMLQSWNPWAPSNRIHPLERLYNNQTGHSLLNDVQFASQRYYVGKGAHFLYSLSSRVTEASEGLQKNATPLFRRPFIFAGSDWRLSELSRQDMRMCRQE